ncbi:cytochrome c-551 precursor [mine drainage metagenome]|uniref:Cytochrome c-551 n=1 Tax=mine drainage metagenome TaxID=410659 RepID=A0A1J5P1L9_9ZZZZ
MKLLSALIIATGLMATSLAYAAPDAAAAQDLLKKSGCNKCHSVDKKKEGPAFKEVAKKLKGQADAEAKLITHITTGPMVEIDGEKEAHAKVKTSDVAQQKNLVQWILSQ